MQSSPRRAGFIVQKNLPKQRGEQIYNQKCIFRACKSFNVMFTGKDCCKYLKSFVFKSKTKKTKKTNQHIDLADNWPLPSQDAEEAVL